MFGNAPLISCILLKPIGSQPSPRAASGLKLRAVDVLPTGAGANAAAEPARAVRRASFMVQLSSRLPAENYHGLQPSDERADSHLHGKDLCSTLGSPKLF